VQVSDLKLSVTGSGDTRLVHVDGFDVKLTSPDETWTLSFDGRCTTSQTTYGPDFWSPTEDPSVDQSLDGLSPAQQQQIRAEERRFQAEQAQREAELERPHRTCPGDTPSESDPFDIGTIGQLGTGAGDFGVTVVQIDGRWYVSPVRTLLDSVDRALQKLTPADLDKFAKWWSDETDPSSSSSTDFGATGSGSGTFEPIGPSTSVVVPPDPNVGPGNSSTETVPTFTVPTYTVPTVTVPVSPPSTLGGSTTTTTEPTPPA
jgi:hypothetical protein